MLKIRFYFFLNTIAFVALVFHPQFCLAQAYSGNACAGKMSAELKSQFQLGHLPAQDGIPFSFYEKFSSSYLQVPPQKLSAQKLEFADEEEQAIQHDKESCQFTVRSLSDADPKTAWCEGVPGDGLDEVALIFTPVVAKMKIWNGYGKSPEAFQNNNRVKKIRIIIFEGANFTTAFSTSEENHVPSLIRRAQQDFELKDVNAFQNITLTHLPQVAPDRQLVLGIQILAVYRGSQFQDTCLSAVQSQ